MSNERVFGGETFRLVSTHTKKSKANEAKQAIIERGKHRPRGLRNAARIIPGKKNGKTIYKVYYGNK